jgi:hypothetical protein
MEKAVSFINNTNHRLFGILHIPPNASELEHHIGINLLNPGLKSRVAPNRLNVKIARKLCDMGFFVLRFDPFGIGDSEGDFMGSNETVIDLWSMIQRGAFVDDTILSNNFFASEVNLNKLILIGQCGAGVTAGLVAALDHRVNHLVLIDTPFRISSSDIELSQAVIDSYDSKQLLKEHLSGLFKFDWLSNIFSNGFNASWFRDKLSVIKKLLSFKGVFKGQNSISKRFNYNLANSLVDFMNKGSNIYFLFAENDFSLREFSNDFRHNFLDKKRKLRKRYSLNIIKNANHTYTETKWQDELLNNISEWLESVMKSQ